MIEETLIKLCRLWCEDSEIQVNCDSKDDVYYTAYQFSPQAIKTNELKSDSEWHPPEPTITNNKNVKPQFIHLGTKNMTQSKTFIDYRLARFRTWHEAQHYLHSDYSNIQNAHLTDCSLEYNIIEDYRVEDIGLVTYRGYQREREFVFKAFEEDSKIGLTANEFFNLRRYVGSKLRFGDERVKYPDVFKDYKHRIDAVVSDCRKFLVPDNPKAGEMTVGYSQTLKKIFDDMRDDEKIRNQMIDLGRERVELLREGANEMPISKPALEKANEQVVEVSGVIEKEFNEGKEDKKWIQKNNDMNEITLLNKSEDMKVRESGENSSRYSEMKSKSTGIMRKLQKSIESIKHNYREVEGDEGDEVEMDTFLTKGSKFYLSDYRDKPINDILIVMDVSGSTHVVADEYLSSCVAVCEALVAAGIRYGLYAFAEPHDEKVLYVVKTKQEPYSNTVKMRIGALESHGDTPLHSLTKTILPVVIKEYRHIIIFTDGASTEGMETRQGFLNLYKTGIPVYVIGYEKAGTKITGLQKYYKAILHPNQFIDSKSIHRISELPDTITEIVRDRQ